MKTYFIINPIAGKGKNKQSIEKIVKLIPKYFDEHEIYFTKFQGDAKNFVSRLKEIECRIICCGGDGTINEVVNGIGAYSSVVLGVIPTGSGNDFAREIGYNFNIDVLLKSFSKSNYKIIDLGHLRITDNNILFAGSCGIGFDALSAYYSSRTKYLRGILLYLISVFKAISTYKSFKAEIHLNESILKKELMMISIGNGKTSGGGFKLLPNAKINDGLIDFCLINSLNPLQLLFYLPLAIWGKHIHIKHSEYFKQSNCKIKLYPGTYIHADGEVISTNIEEIEVTVIKNGLKVLNSNDN